MAAFRIGTAAWTIPKPFSRSFPSTGSHLERYSRRLSAVEINTSFYRDHKPETYAKWADAVPEDFRFAVKLSWVFTQERRLQDTDGLSEVLEGVLRLGSKLGVILVQLPPSLDFQMRDAGRFFRQMRESYGGAIALEPRHLSWSSSAAVRLMREEGISKVIADPERCPMEGAPRAEVEYVRLHGTPEIYRSRYEGDAMDRWEAVVREAGAHAREVWCIFDNTTFGFATENALQMRDRLQETSRAKRAS